MVGRRGFIFGLGATLAVIPAANLMKLWVPPKTIAADRGLIYRGDLVVGSWDRAETRQIHYSYKVPNEWNSGTGWVSPHIAREMFRISGVDARPAV